MSDMLTNFGTPSDPRFVRAIELIWREAEMLDRKEYEAWKELFTDDAIYVVPIDPETTEFADTLNMIYDDTRMRDLRVTRMVGGHAIAPVDAARTARTVSRFVPKSISDNEVVLHSTQILVAYKRGRHDIWAGDVEHRILLSPDGASGDRIGRKVIRLIDSHDAVPAAGFLL